MSEIYNIEPLTPGEKVPMYAYGTLKRALEKAQELNLTSYKISKGRDNPDDPTRSDGWDVVYLHLKEF